MSASPSDEYHLRLAERRRTAARLDLWDRWGSGVRALLAVASVLLAWGAFARHAVPAASLLLPAALFAIVVVLHARLATRRARVGRAIHLYESALRRLSGTWPDPQLPGAGVVTRADPRVDAIDWDGASFPSADHPCATDLDLFGPRSLFAWLSTARTSGGARTLAAWLSGPPPPAAGDDLAVTLRERQVAVQTLAPRLDLREGLWIAGEDVRAELDEARLAAWGRGRAALEGWRLGALLLVLSGAMVVCGIGWLAGRLPGAAAAGALLLVFVVTQVLKGRVGEALREGARPEAELALVAELCHLFERGLAEGAGTGAFEPPPLGDSPRLRELYGRLMSREGAGAGAHSDAGGASLQIARLGRLVDWLQARRNLLFAPVAYALLWEPQLACAIERWRRRHGPHIGAWLESLCELEALCSLASHAYEHPALPFPRIVTAGEGPLVRATSLRHPLLAGCVPNDVHLGGADADGPGPRLIVLSGSNMSGKSTLMRSLGVNVVLALAGARVHAESMTLCPLRVGASLRIEDSLAAGVSRFYAEIKRLKQLADLARGPLPLLFLIDEILAGTNSHDRRLGAAAVLSGLVERGAIGIASTHDLALTKVVAELPPGQAANFHFEDSLDGSVLHFDYRLRPGVVERSNALALMRALGFDV